MSEDLTTGIVRILTAGDTTAGTGFIVTDDGLIATCAHVVQGAGAGPGDTVRVVFHTTGEEREAQVEPAWWRAPDAEDVVILRLDGPVPEGVIPLSLGSSAGVEGHALSTFGFPDPKPVEGMAGKCEVVGRTTERGFPVLQLRSSEVTPGFSGAPVLDTVTRRVVGMVTAITVPDQYGRLPETAFITPTETLRAVCPELQLSDLCPYQGLAAFTKDHAEFFFGRDPLVTDLVDHLRGNPRFLAVVGPSGSGKSSVVRAGLFPALHRGEVPGSADWHLLSFRPGADPFAALNAAGLTTFQENDLQTCRPADLQTCNLQAAIRAFLDTHPQIKRLVLFADQFEELFTLCPQPVQEQFLRQLSALLESNLSVTLVLTLRADFYGHLLRHRPLVDWLKIGQVNVPPMGPEELRAAVEEPATRLGLRFEPGLVETIVEEAGAADHPLPLLESALTQLWEKREDGLLTHAAYQAVGQVAGAIGQWAEDAYTELAPQERPLARRVFTRLVRYGEGEVADTRRQQSLSELVTRPEEQEPLHQLVQRLADARLLVTGGDPGAETVEIIHDALLQQWGRLKHWIAEQREFYLWRQRLDEWLQEWEEQGRDEGALLRGALLAEAERWLAERSDDLNLDEQAYIRESVAVRERERAVQGRRRRRLTLATVGAAVVFLVLALLAWGQRNTAVTEAIARATAQAQAEAASTQAITAEQLARARLLVAQGQMAFEESPLLGVRLALEGLTLLPPDDTASQASFLDSVREMAQRGRLLKLGDDIVAVTPSPNGTVFILSRRDAPDALYRATDGVLIHTFTNKIWLRQPSLGMPGVRVADVDFSTDENASLFTMTYDDAPHEELRRSSDGTLVPLTGVASKVDFHLASSGTYFLVDYEDAPTELRRTADGVLTYRFARPVSGVRLSPDPHANYFLVSYMDGPVELRRTTDNVLIRTLKGRVSNTAFSPDSNAAYLVVTYESDLPYSQLYRTADGALIETFHDVNYDDEDSSHSHVTFSPDAEAAYLVVHYISAPSEIRRAADGTLVYRFTGSVYRVELSPDPRATYFVAYETNASAELYRTADGTLVPLSGKLYEVTFSPDMDATCFVTEYADVPGELRRTTDAALIQTLTSQVSDVSFSPDTDATYFVAEYADVPGELRRTTDAALVRTLAGQVIEVSFSPDPSATYFLVQYEDASPELRRTADGSLVGQLEIRFYDVFFGPGGSYFWIGGLSDMPVQLCRTADGAPVPLSGVVISPNDFLFSPDPAAAHFVVKYVDERSELWNGQNGYRLTDLGLGLNTTYWEKPLFSPDAKRLTIRYTDGRAYLLDIAWLEAMRGDVAGLSLEKLMQIICQGPLASGLLDEASLTSYLEGRSPQACR